MNINMLSLSQWQLAYFALDIEQPNQPHTIPFTWTDVDSNEFKILVTTDALFQNFSKCFKTYLFLAISPYTEWTVMI